MRGLSNHPTERIRATAARHHGVVTVKILAELGVSRNSLRDRLRCGELTRTALRGVFIVADLTDPWTTATVSLGRSSLLGLSGRTAASWYGWDGFDRRPPPAVPDLVSPWSSRSDLRPYRRRDLRRADLVDVRGLRATSPAVTLAMVGESMGADHRGDRDRLEQAVECALRRGEVTEDELWDQATVRPGASSLAHILARRGRPTPPTGSLLETLAVQRVLRPFGIEVLGRQVEVYDHGEFVARYDFLLDGWMFFEVDGGQHDRPDARSVDRRRDLRLKGYGLEVARADREDIIGAGGVLAARLRRAVDLGRRNHGGEPVPVRHGRLWLDRQR